MSIVRTIRGAAMIAVAGVALAGCQTFGLGRSGLVASTVTTDLATGSVTAIASDMVGQLTRHIGPGGTTIQLKGDGSAFGTALEEALRSTGYAVSAQKSMGSGDAMELAYVVDEFEGSVLVRLSTASLDLTRIYRVEGDTAVPASPVSVMRRDDVAVPA